MQQLSINTVPIFSPVVWAVPSSVSGAGGGWDSAARAHSPSAQGCCLPQMPPKHSEPSKPAEASKNTHPCSSRSPPGAAHAAFTAAAFSPGRTPGRAPGSLKRQEFVLTPACKKHLAPALQLPAVPNLLAPCRGWHQLCAGGLLDPARHLNFILISLFSFFSLRRASVSPWLPFSSSSSCWWPGAAGV